MSLFRRNKGAREETDEAAAAEPGLSAATTSSGDPADAATAEQPAAAAIGGQREPAELDALVGEAPTSRRRGKLRRRLRHLRRVREVLLRDLGGLTFELHRTGSREGGAVLEGKLARLTTVDREIRDLEDRLSDHRAMIVREPGIGGTCTACGELFGSEARYCWACGNPVAAGAGGAPHLAAWTTHPQLTGGSPATPPTELQPPSHDATWVDHPAPEDHPTAPLPQMNPEEVAALEPQPNEPATGDVGGDEGAMWSDHSVEGSAVEEPAAPQDEPAAPPEEPAAPQDEPAAPPEEPAAPQDEPAAAPEEPAAPQDEPAAAPAPPEEPPRAPAPPMSSGDPLAQRPGH
jgi:hypothetical protein